MHLFTVGATGDFLDMNSAASVTFFVEVFGVLLSGGSGVAGVVSVGQVALTANRARVVRFSVRVVRSTSTT